MRDLNIEPVEELVVTTKIIHEKIGRHEVDTVMTRRKGLHWLTGGRKCHYGLRGEAGHHPVLHTSPGH